ncbi:hypothetical protein [Caballeronia telluris]|uniref:hypothetical protein n=1 Tax=Caballeronia telluris TaxID=326475 RepID=UPI000A6BA756|nr:hypothetical protein [Caballeronia telluris]
MSVSEKWADCLVPKRNDRSQPFAFASMCVFACLPGHIVGARVRSVFFPLMPNCNADQKMPAALEAAPYNKSRKQESRHARMHPPPYESQTAASR